VVVRLGSFRPQDHSAVGSESTLNLKMLWRPDFLYIPNDAKFFQNDQRPVAGIDLPPLESEAGGTGKAVLIVMEPLAHHDRGNWELVPHLLRRRISPGFRVWPGIISRGATAHLDQA